MNIKLPDIIIEGVGTSTCPALTHAIVQAIAKRAGEVEDKQIRNDLFWLVKEWKREHPIAE